MTFPDSIASGLRLPLIAAPMLRISGVDLTTAACVNGVIGSFPTVNAREPEELDAWLTQFADNCARAERPTAPVCPNVLMRTDPDAVAQPVSKERSRELFSAYAGQMRGPKRWVDLWSAGHTVSAVERVTTVAELVDELAGEYASAKVAARALLDD